MSDLIFDLGMHFGEDTDYYLARGFRVVAFEADPELVQRNANFFKKQIDNGELVIISGAIACSSLEKITLYKNIDRPFWNTTSKTWDVRNRRLGSKSMPIQVPTVSLADAIVTYGTPYYMKIDIEGADLLALEQLGTCSVRPKYLSIESEKVDLNALERELNILCELGYRSFKAIQQANANTLTIPHDTKYLGRSYQFQRGSSGLFGSDLPGLWKTKEQILEEYKHIFRRYARFGDESWLRRAQAPRLALSGIERLFNIPLPGWYDTHASLLLPEEH